MEPSKVDLCIWYKEGFVLVIYVDDCIIYSKDKEGTDELIDQLRENFTLTDEGDVDTYLGVQILLNEKENSIELKQRDSYIIK